MVKSIPCMRIAFLIVSSSLSAKETIAFLTPATVSSANLHALENSWSSCLKATDDDKENRDAGSSRLVAEQSSTKSPVTSTAPDQDIDWENVGKLIVDETKEFSDCLGLAFGAVISEGSVKAEDIVKVCDDLDELLATTTTTKDTAEGGFRLTESLQIRKRALEFRRYELLAKLMQQDYDAYVATASFLSPSRIPRNQLPNLQDVPYDATRDPQTKQTVVDDNGLPLVADCELEDMKYKDSPLDVLLLSIFRKLVAKHTGGVTSEKEGIQGLLEQGRTFMLQPNQTPEAQHQMVYNTLGGLMTPVLPPFYRIFMSGIVPQSIGGEQWGGKQLGPWFYAPWLTSFVTPTFFGFLVGPSYPNRRKDGQPGGLVVEKCKFLQESGCKGLCLNQCKLPAQKFFQEELGLPLTVSPNFVTQECQWSFGETPLPPSEDPSFPKGCLVGCESRKAIVAAGGPVSADLCM